MYTSCHSDHSDALQASQQLVAKFGTHPSIALFAVFLTCSMKFVYCNWQMLWKLGNEHNAAFSTVGRVGLDEARAIWRCRLMWYLLAVNFASRVGSQLLCVWRWGCFLVAANYINQCAMRCWPLPAEQVELGWGSYNIVLVVSLLVSLAIASAVLWQLFFQLSTEMDAHVQAVDVRLFFSSHMAWEWG